MPKPDAPKTMTFKSPKELSKWLQANHATESELLIKMFKKGSGIPSVNWNEVVIESLCWGWIDGVKKSLDDQAYLQRITPRKARSNWSKRNTERFEFPLDPIYEPEMKGRDPGMPPPKPENTRIFAVLQIYNRLNLLVPVNAPHMWNAAMESKSCMLTALGEHYRRLVEKKRI